MFVVSAAAAAVVKAVSAGAIRCCRPCCSCCLFVSYNVQCSHRRFSLKAKYLCVFSISIVMCIQTSLEGTLRPEAREEEQMYNAFDWATTNCSASCALRLLLQAPGTAHGGTKPSLIAQGLGCAAETMRATGMRAAACSGRNQQHTVHLNVNVFSISDHQPITMTDARQMRMHVQFKHVLKPSCKAGVRNLGSRRLQLGEVELPLDPSDLDMSARQRGGGGGRTWFGRPHVQKCYVLLNNSRGTYTFDMQPSNSNRPTRNASSVAEN